MKYQNNEVIKSYQDDPFIQRQIKGPTVPAEPLPGRCVDYKTITDESGFYYAFLGHSSVYLKIGSYRILIDPILNHWGGPLNIGMKRFTQEVPTADLFDNIDIILITHNHYDHLDLQTLKRFKNKTGLYIVPVGVKKLLTFFGFDKEKIIELNWWEKWQKDDLTITFLPTHHNSVRYLFDNDKSLWGSYWIKAGNHSVYHSGDGAFAQHFQQIAKTIGKPELVFMECGQYDQQWHHMHMFPEESVEACRILNGKVNVPIHWGAYCICFHYWKEPVLRFEQRARELSIPYQIPKLYEIVDVEKIIEKK